MNLSFLKRTVMRKIQFLLFGCFLLVSSAGKVLAQSNQYQPAIQEKMNQFISLSNEQKWSEAFDLLYPKLFQTVGKHELVGMMENMASEGMSNTTENFKVVSFSELKTFNGEDFVLIKYDSDQKLKMSPAITADDEMRKTVLLSLRQSMGEENVAYDSKSEVFVIKGTKSMYAISNEGENNWFLVDNNTNQDELLTVLIPAQIRNELNQ